ncbi:MAG: D-cysteine desulfhydrase [Rhodospirillaceae bacterium]|nr:D-cysteine desulfhydrase [Rhodospirillaceae bacterium]
MEASTSADSARIDLGVFPRVALCHQPTPIEAMLRLSDHLGGPNIFIKRDDCTGLATGGNKTRKLEFLVGEALKQNADMLVTQGAVQSNHVRQTAAAACRVGLRCHALLERRVPDVSQDYEETGNVLLDRLFGASIEFRGPGLDMNAEGLEATERLRAEGHKPYFIPGGGSNEIGALGYVSCAQEISMQSDAMNINFDWIVMATGSTGTQAGLVAGLHALGRDLPVMGISVRQPREAQIKAVHALTERTLAKINAGGIASSKIIVDDGYVGDGYGVPAASTLDAINQAARLEGLLLDPVYSGKGFAGLIGLVKANFFKPSDRILFLHTGGSAALFAYEEMLLSAQSAK